VKVLAQDVADVGEAAARQTVRTAGVPDVLSDAAKIATPYNRALATAAEAAAATGDYTRAVYRAATGRTDPFVVRKVAERVLRAAGVEDALISRAVAGISRASTNAADVFVDIQKGLLDEAYEGAVKPYLVDTDTLQQVERGLKLGIPDDYVMITDDIAVPRSIADDLREWSSQFAQSQILRDQAEKVQYLERVINTYTGKVDESLLQRLRDLRDGVYRTRVKNIQLESLEELTDADDIARRDGLIMQALEWLRPAAKNEDAGRQLVGGYRYKRTNEIKQTLSEAMREGIPDKAFADMDLSTRQLVVERLKEHYIMRQAANTARNTMDVGAMQLYLDRSIKGFNNLLDFRALNTPFSRRLMALFGRKLDDTTKFSVDMANLLRRAGRNRTRQIARLVEQQAAEINAHIVKTLRQIRNVRTGRQKAVLKASKALRNANKAFEAKPTDANFEAVKAAQDALAAAREKADKGRATIEAYLPGFRAKQRRIEQYGTAVVAVETLLERMAREGRIGPDQIWEQLFSTMFNPKLNREILKQALEEAGLQGALARYPTVETINTVARVAQDIPQIRWAGRTTPFTNDAVKHMLAAMMDGPIREAAARGIITRELQRKMNLSPYIKASIEKQMGITEIVFDPATGKNVEEASRKLGLIFPVDRPLGASRLASGVDTEFERVIARGGGEFLEVLNYIPPKYRASLGGLANGYQAGSKVRVCGAQPAFPDL
jgi:hypothetical protein